METVNVVNEIDELKNQLMYIHNLGFFFGAGTSCAFGLPGIEDLTNNVEKSLNDEFKTHFNKIKKDSNEINGCEVNIENILNHIRQIRDITQDKKEFSFQNINGQIAKELDLEICSRIQSILSDKEKDADFNHLKDFLLWFNSFFNYRPKEIFTLNYDLLVEKSLDKMEIPYFDGFVGAYEPFFSQENVENVVNNKGMFNDWLKIWKMHGSLNWIWSDDNSNPKILRVGKFDKSDIGSEELVIYPSKEKYNLSRKQPFISFFDRLKSFLTSDETFLIISGYSFSDQHVNEIIFSSLKHNLKLSIVAFLFSDDKIEDLKEEAKHLLNLRVFGPTKAIIRGRIVQWNYNDDNNEKDTFLYWDTQNSELILGDFESLIDFLINISPKKLNGVLKDEG